MFCHLSVAGMKSVRGLLVRALLCGAPGSSYYCRRGKKGACWDALGQVTPEVGCIECPSLSSGSMVEGTVAHTKDVCPDSCPLIIPISTFTSRRCHKPTIWLHPLHYIIHLSLSQLHPACFSRRIIFPGHCHCQHLINL